jgi:hypothetical protein
VRGGRLGCVATTTPPGALPQATVKLAFGQQNRISNRCQAQCRVRRHVSPISRAAASGRFVGEYGLPRPITGPPYRQQITAPFGFSGLTWCSVIGRQR